MLPLGLVPNHLQTNHREGCADTHHHVRVIDRLAIGTDAGEGDRLVAKIIGKALDHLWIRTI